MCRVIDGVSHGVHHGASRFGSRSRRSPPWRLREQTVTEPGEEDRMERMSEPADRTVALVTGAAQGIGLGIARSLAAASYKVVLADIEDELVQQSAAKLRGCGLRGGRRASRCDPGRRLGPGGGCGRVPVGRARSAGQLRGHQPARDGGIDRRGPLGSDAGDQPQGSVARHQGGDALICGSAGGRSSTSARRGRPGRCRGCFPTSSAKPVSGV